MAYQAIIFDLDGTLLDTLEDLADSMNSVLNEYGLPEHDLTSYRYFVGEGVEVLVRKSLPSEKRTDTFIAHCVMRMKEEYGKRWAKKTRPYIGIPEMLDAVTSRGIRMAVLSNKPDEFTRLIVTSLLPRWQFPVILGSRSSLPKKPDPTAALLIAETLHIPPRNVLFLGDTRIDMETARAAGMYPVGVLWGFRTSDELTSSGARALISNPAELLELV